MAPIATSDLVPLSPAKMDPMVYPAPDADEELKRLWNLHGDPHSAKFSNPKLTSVAALVEHNAITQPSKPAFIYPAGNSFNILDWAQVHSLACRASGYYSQQFQKQLEAANETRQQPTVALLGTGNSIEYLITQIALNRLRVRTLLLSNKNSSETRAHLLRVCNAVAVVVDEANEPSLDADGACGQQVAGLISLAELQQCSEEVLEVLVVFETSDEWNLQSIIIHSSGSTSVPKPIIHTNRSLCQIGRMYRLMPEYFISNWYLCFPLFHIAGLSVALSGIPTGLPTTLPPEQWPPAPSAILSAWKWLEEIGCPTDCLHCAPSVIEDLTQYISLTTKDFTPLTKLKVLQPGGAPLFPTTLSKLQVLGVNIKTTYGTTETGPPFRTIPHTRDNPDVYRFRNLYPESPLVRMEPLGEGLFECVVYKGFPLAAELWLDDAVPNPYRTGDLFLEEPPASGYFVLQGRRDDILVHSNGEKTNAAALAMALEEEGNGVVVKTAVYGTGHPCPSVVVEVNWDEVDKQPEEVEDAVWRVISRVNEKTPVYSRIPRQSVLILTRGEALPVTPKGNVRRNIAWGLFGSQVEDLYTGFLGKLETDDSAEAQTNGASPATIETVRDAVADVFGVSPADIEDDQSWYGLGLDSLKAVELRSKLVKSFGKFPLMFVFEYPTAKGLFNFFQRPKDDSSDNHAAITSQHHEWIHSAVRRMNSEIDEWAKTRPRTSGINKGDDGATIYLTGASGSLGNALLEVLVQLPMVKAIYCAVRGSDPQARVSESLKSRGYSAHIYQSDKIRAVCYDMTDERLGLEQQTYETLANEVTIVMHNAWKLDFNQPVQLFKDDCLRGTMHLMSFCLKGKPKTFAFMSSVAAAMGNPSGTLIPETPLGPDPASALATGYAQSKFVVERVTQYFASSLEVPVRVLRVSQLCGHSRLGTWNSTEMWPIMMMAGLDSLSAMPVLGERVDWLPVDWCAGAIRDAVVASSDGEGYTVTNLTNPSATSWDELLSYIEEASGKSFERIGMSEWVSRLETAASDGSREKMPAMKLLGFFQTMAEGGGNGEGVTFESGRLEQGRRIDVEMVSKWLESWRQECVLKL